MSENMTPSKRDYIVEFVLGVIAAILVELAISFRTTTEYPIDDYLDS